MKLIELSKFNCRFCGSDNLTNIRVTLKKTRTDQLKPEVSYQKIKASVGSLTRKKESGTSYITKFCTTCRNIDAVNIENPTPPLEAYISDFQKWVIIPYMLSTHLKGIKYDEVEITRLLRCIRNCLEKIYNKWSIDGLNICKCNHMGRKIIIPLKHGVGIMCWVIVDSIKNKIYLRLSYGGNKIECPEN